MISKSPVKPIQKLIYDTAGLKEPNDAKALRRFLGAVVFYHWMTRKLSETMAPLYDLLSKSDRNKKITLKITHTNMEPFDHKKVLILCTDVSKIAVGASLNHEFNGRPAPIGFVS